MQSSLDSISTSPQSTLPKAQSRKQQPPVSAKLNELPRANASRSRVLMLSNLCIYACQICATCVSMHKALGARHQFPLPSNGYLLFATRSWSTPMLHADFLAELVAMVAVLLHLIGLPHSCLPSNLLCFRFTLQTLFLLSLPDCSDHEIPCAHEVRCLRVDACSHSSSTRLDRGGSVSFSRSSVVPTQTVQYPSSVGLAGTFSPATTAAEASACLARSIFATASFSVPSVTLIQLSFLTSAEASNAIKTSMSLPGRRSGYIGRLLLIPASISCSVVASKVRYGCWLERMNFSKVVILLGYQLVNATEPSKTANDRSNFLVVVR
ncbi:hypothetical protein KCU74_g95, partial [Aureobasidium melanogenum]